MLETLRSIIQEVNSSNDLDQVLNIIVGRVKIELGVDVCSVYLRDFQMQQHVLMATDGLRHGAVANVRLGLGEGLVGQVAKREEPLNLENAMSSKFYRYFPETGEERYPSFLGVPIIHHRIVLGVLVVQSYKSKKFNEDQEAFLITIAAQLAGAIAHAQASGGITGLGVNSIHVSGPIKGVPGSPGVAVGRAVVVYPTSDLNAIPDRNVEDINTEINVFRQAVESVKRDIKAILSRIEDNVSSDERAIFETYLLMLRRESLIGVTLDKINLGKCASIALRDAVADYVNVFDKMEDPYLRERGEDIKDIGRRILVHIQKGIRNKFVFPPNTIIVGENISATMIAEIPRECLGGVICRTGSSTSHLAIFARALNVCAVMGLEDLPIYQLDGVELIVDGYQGLVHVSPASSMIKQYRKFLTQERQLTDELKELTNEPSVTDDGKEIPLFVNTGIVADISPSLINGADGIGLYRTEFPFMVRERFPSEEEQRRIYLKVLKAYSPRPVTLRTLDIGGDKSLPYFPINEDNPFLGWRGIRVTLDHPELFLVQLRAMLRASIGLENLKILFPMISTVSELDESLVLLRRAYDELVESGDQIKMPQVGVMIEVPSATYIIPEIAPKVDFLTIGTNDLIQYIMAADRNNTRVATLYDALQIPVLRALIQIISCAHESGKPIGVCGEMAGDPAAVILLLAMNVDYLSMSASSIPRIKWVIRSFSQNDTKTLLSRALAYHSPGEIQILLNEALDKAGLAGLVRAGG